MPEEPPEHSSNRYGIAIYPDKAVTVGVDVSPRSLENQFPDLLLDDLKWCTGALPEISHIPKGMV
jgi:hypothetical protein